MPQDYLDIGENAEIFGRKQQGEVPQDLWVSNLDAYKACRFQAGFAPEGFLCHEPPIPLRVLDFLEARDLVNLSRMCKRTHHAGHVQFQREVWPWSICLAR